MGDKRKKDFNSWDKSPIEKVHLKFCKMYLATSRKATVTLPPELSLENSLSLLKYSKGSSNTSLT
jgi:hypothetical protein